MSSNMILRESVLQALLTSLLVGGIYGLLCVGLGLIFSVMLVIFCMEIKNLQGQRMGLVEQDNTGLSPKDTTTPIRLIVNQAFG